MASYEKWSKRIKDNLSKYKVETLKIVENGVWKKNKKQYSHILPIEYGELNYLCDYAKNALAEDEKHSDWNHLNSSQTMCVNFFAPLRKIENGRYLNLLMSHLLKKDVSLKESCFEYVPEEKSTNFDFYVKDKSDGQYFFEIKYTEQDIDKSGGGKCPFNAYKTFYSEDVESNPAFINVDKDMFMKKHYQAYRNMVKGKGNDYSFFITMKSNEGTFKELQSALYDLHVESVPNVIALYWEELIE